MFSTKPYYKDYYDSRSLIEHQIFANLTARLHEKDALMEGKPVLWLETIRLKWRCFVLPTNSYRRIE